MKCAFDEKHPVRRVGGADGAEETGWKPNHSTLSAELCLESQNRLTDLILFFHAPCNTFAGMQHCPVIPAAELFANLMQRRFGHVPSQVHRNLTRK